MTSGHEPDEKTAQELRRLEAQARAGMAFSAVGTSLIALGCVTPIVVLVVVIAWAVYGTVALVVAGLLGFVLACLIDLAVLKTLGY